MNRDIFEFQKVGRKRTFPTGQDMINKLEEYVEVCKAEDRFPNVSGFTRHCKIDRTTYYLQKNSFPKEFSICESIFEDEALQHNTNVAQLYLMNKCGYRSKQESANINTTQTSEAEKLWESINKLPEDERRKTIDKITKASGEELGDIVRKLKVVE
jgi:hypothetical protein